MLVSIPAYRVQKLMNIFARLHRALTLNLLLVPRFFPFVYNVGQKLS